MDVSPRAAFASRGYCALRGVLSAEEVKLLREDNHAILEALLARGGSLLDEACVLDPVPYGIPERHAARTCVQAYLPLRQASRSGSAAAALEALLLSKLPAVVGELGAGSSFLFNEHHVTKPTGGETAFRWHTDAAHQLEALLALRQMGGDTTPSLDEQADYTSVWCALDDITECNGALLLLPRDGAQPPSPWYLPADAASESWLRSSGRSLAVAATVRAGDVIVFSSRIWHCSDPNVSGTPRRAFYAQYAQHAVGGESPICLAIRTQPSAALVPPLALIELSPLASSTLTQYETDDET
ncbi:hypothetical protein AB1Y20_010057 [Prymnesium parvum]|uniref:Uncharacterized protein n=1 Tax=Prymnesium parvum TaxID=97485 RepID=A0AB34K3X7_PRYPA